MRRRKEIVECRKEIVERRKEIVEQQQRNNPEYLYRLVAFVALNTCFSGTVEDCHVTYDLAVYVFNTDYAHPNKRVHPMCSNWPADLPWGDPPLLTVIHHQNGLGDKGSTMMDAELLNRLLVPERVLTGKSWACESFKKATKKRQKLLQGLCCVNAKAWERCGITRFDPNALTAKEMIEVLFTQRQLRQLLSSLPATDLSARAMLKKKLVSTQQQLTSLYLGGVCYEEKRNEDQKGMKNPTRQSNIFNQQHPFRNNKRPESSQAQKHKWTTA